MPIKKPIDRAGNAQVQQQIIVDEYAAAAALGVSVHYLRRDRCTKRTLPYFKLGDLVRYNLPRVIAALEAGELGGPPQKKGRAHPGAGG